MNQEYFREEGWDAYYSGKSINDNPYNGSDARHHQWNNGFNSAKFNDSI